MLAVAYVRDVLYLDSTFHCALSLILCAVLAPWWSALLRIETKQLYQSQRSASNSPIKTAHRRSCSPWYGSVHSPPLCNSPTRYSSRFYSRSRHELGDRLCDNCVQESVQNKAYFSPKPPSEPVQVIIEPRIINDLDYKYNSVTSHESRCFDEFNITSSLSALAETNTDLWPGLRDAAVASPTCHNSVAIVHRILSSVLTTLPLVDPPSEVSDYPFMSEYYFNKPFVRSEPEQRSVAVQVAKSYTTVSVGNSREYYAETGNEQKKVGSKKRWMGSMRALRESQLRLMMRQIRQLRQIERLDRSLKRVCSVQAACENHYT